jgi:diguanylate cyclase (GGDEF)-like protein/PAS domain S-box-containing protein
MTGDPGVAATGLVDDPDPRFVRALIEHSADIVSVVAADGTLIFHYPPAVLGYQGGENFGRRIFEFLHPDDVEAAIERFGRVLTEPGTSPPFECRVRTADGSWRWMEVVGENLIDDPAVRGVVINGHDITRRKQVLAALTQSEERFRALVQHSTDIIAVVDEAGTLLYASPATETVLGYPEGSLIGTNAFELVHPDDTEIAIVTLAQVVEDPDAHPRLELRIRHADGGWRHIEYSASNLLDDPSVRGVVLNSREVTDRRLAEEVEREQHHWFRSLVQHGSDIIAVVSRDGDVHYVSPSVQHIMGYDPDGLLGSVGFDFVHEDDLAGVANQFAAVTSTPGFHAPFLFRARHADGSWRWLEMVNTNELDDPAVRGIVVNIRDVTERHEFEEQLAHQALHDSLTRLPNRVLLNDRLDQALARAVRDRTNVGVIFLDIDRFKLVNDTRGHVAGDALLVAVAERLEHVTAVGDTVARFGGDEFVIVYEDVDTTEALVERSQWLCQALAAPFEVDGVESFVTVSVGVALGPPGASADGLLRDADAAMYHAKEQGGGTVEAFAESIRRRSHQRYETERALHTALERDQLAIVYQPIVELETGRIVSVEALLRWDHPELGTIAPGDFIGLAEETGLIVPIGAQVLRTACAQLAEWRRNSAADVALSVNVSAVQLRSPALTDHVTDAVTSAGIPPDALTLEITESLLLEDTTACLDALTALKDLGVALSVDDFGTRYSSLGYLNRMPLDCLKVDRMFVNRLGLHHRDNAIVSAIVAMAHALDLLVVAEGVESGVQRAHLLELGCSHGQGYAFAKPGRVDEVSRLLEIGTLPLS